MAPTDGRAPGADDIGELLGDDPPEPAVVAPFAEPDDEGGPQ